MSVKIITDSASDMDLETIKKLDVHMLHLKIAFDDEEFYDGKNMTHNDFFEKLIETDVLPVTSQITPFEYEECFNKVLNEGDEAVLISISSKLSGCYQNALMTANSFEKNKVYVVDSLNASLGQYALVLLAVKLRDEGKSAKEITDILDEEKKKIRLIALIDTLEYLEKGGRLSKGAAIAGKLISIKPVIGVDNGEVTVLGKARGSKKGNNLLTEIAKKSGGMNYSLPVVLAYSGLSDALLLKYIEDNKYIIEKNIDVNKIPRISIGAAIGTHIGPGAIGIAFFSRLES